MLNKVKQEQLLLNVCIKARAYNDSFNTVFRWCRWQQ